MSYPLIDPFVVNKLFEDKSTYYWLMMETVWRIALSSHSWFAYIILPLPPPRKKVLQSFHFLPFSFNFTQLAHLEIRWKKTRTPLENEKKRLLFILNFAPQIFRFCGGTFFLIATEKITTGRGFTLRGRPSRASVAWLRRDWGKKWGFKNKMHELSWNC